MPAHPFERPLIEQPPSGDPGGSAEGPSQTNGPADLPPRSAPAPLGPSCPAGKPVFSVSGQTLPRSRAFGTWKSRGCVPGPDQASPGRARGLPRPRTGPPPAAHGAASGRARGRLRPRAGPPPAVGGV